MSKGTLTITVRAPKPNEGRAKFSICVLKTVDGKRRSKLVTSAELDRINKAYLAGTYTFDEAKALVSDLRNRIIPKYRKRPTKLVTANENIKLLQSYWERDYSFRDVVDPSTMRNAMHRALNVIGALSLETADLWELQKAVMTAQISNGEKRRVTGCINTLLRFAGRGFKLRPPKPEFKQPKYLTEDEAVAVSRHIGGVIGDLVLIAFATGARVGELFSITPFGADKAHIGSQIKRDGKRSHVKNRKPRSVKVMRIGMDPLARWISMSAADRLKYRNARFSETVKNAAKVLWPDRHEKHIVFHDLRHSFAIAQLAMGRSISQVARLLGDSYQVTEMYYLGFAVTSEELDSLT